MSIHGAARTISGSPERTARLFISSPHPGRGFNQSIDLHCNHAARARHWVYVAQHGCMVRCPARSRHLVWVITSIDCLCAQ